MKEASKILDEYNRNIFGIELIFSPLREYQDVMEKFLSDYANKYDLKGELARIEEESKDYDYENRGTFLSHFSQGAFERNEELNIMFPNNFRYAFIGQIASFIEYELKAICNFYAKQSGSKYILDDLMGSEYDKVALFLKKSAAISVNELNPEWDMLRQFWTLRKRIVHHQGLINQDDFDKKLKDIKPLLNSENAENGLLQIIVPDKMLGVMYIETSREFFDKLIKKLGLSRK